MNNPSLETHCYHCVSVDGTSIQLYQRDEAFLACSAARIFVENENGSWARQYQYEDAHHWLSLATRKGIVFL